VRSSRPRNAAFTGGKRAPGGATFNAWNDYVFDVGGAMNSDLMITIALCLYVVIGSLAMGTLAAKSIHDDQVEETGEKARDEA
jgi:hypothetical protein